MQEKSCSTCIHYLPDLGSTLRSPGQGLCIALYDDARQGDSRVDSDRPGCGAWASVHDPANRSCPTCARLRPYGPRHLALTRCQIDPRLAPTCTGVRCPHWASSTREAQEVANAG